MRFVALQSKRSANIAEHGFNLGDFEVAFDSDDFITIPTRPSPTGRKRLKLIGMWFGEVVVVEIVSPLGSEATSVVSVPGRREGGGAL